MLGQKPLPRKFYMRDPKLVARDLLGKILVRRLNGHFLEGVIVETEAYYGVDDPASRARNGMKTYNAPMWGEVGLAFIYNVHNNWMFNIVAHEPNGVGAVLIRAIEPLKGIDIVVANRKVHNIINLTNGPGRLTKALKINKELNCIDLTDNKNLIFISNGKFIDEQSIERSHRIGVSKDLNIELRFYVKDNPFVSKGRIKSSSQS